MFIKVEPAGFFMYTVQLIFDPASPDSEDQEVRDYLTDHELEPRYQYEIEEGGRPCEVLQFGGCYLGRHLQTVGQIQRHAVEVELLTAEVEKPPGSPGACRNWRRTESGTGLKCDRRRWPPWCLNFTRNRRSSPTRTGSWWWPWTGRK